MKKAVTVGLLFVVTLTCLGLGREIVVTSTADSGTGSFRWALQKARSGDTITFDTGTFPPENPATIYPRSELPPINCGNLTIDASNAGVIIDGKNIRSNWTAGLEIRSSNNIIRGLQIINFSGVGIGLFVGSQNNIIGGDRKLGAGPTGQGNALGGNNGGIGLWDRHTSYNTVTCNLIGANLAGRESLGNIDGVVIADGASGNTIGPSNVIADNQEHAILVIGPHTTANTITQNSIYHNAWGGIQLLESGNHALLPPLITAFDVESGVLTGTACRNCVIELFSEETSWGDCEDVRRLSAEGRVYEGHTETTHDETFSFDKGAPFEYPHLTATATDAEGNTSEFSLATSAMTRLWGLQSGNEQPMYRLAPAQGSQREYNRIGTMLPLLDSARMEDADVIIRRMDSLGFMWNKFYIDVPDWPEVGVYEGYSDGNVTPAQDRLVEQFVERGWKIVLGLVFWDESANNRIPEQGKNYSRYETKKEIQAYLDFAQTIVHHFKGRVEYYEILNEPNAAKGTQQYVAVDHYINLVRQVVPIIRQEDPQAKIVVGAIAFPTVEEEAIEYLLQVAKSDVMPLVDGLSWHPFDGASPNDPVSQDYYYAYPGLVHQVKDVASSNGFTGEYMASEMLWRTPLTLHIGHGAVCSPTQAAKYYAREITLNLGMDIVAGIGGADTVTPIVSVARNLCTIMAGHEAIDMPVKVDINYDGPVAYCAFRYPNGDRLLAVWTDGVAQDDDPGVPATITFPGLTAGTVTGIDVLHGFEQELVFETDGNSTIIRDLLVKDYPILIRLSNVTFGPDYVETVGDGFHRLGDVNAVQSSSAGGTDRDGDGVPDDEDYCPDWPGSKEANGC